MKLFNCRIVCDNTGLGASRCTDLLRYVDALGDKSSPLYNPVARKVLKSLFSAITFGQKKKAQLYYQLFTGQVETLLAQAYSDVPGDDKLDGTIMMDKAAYQEMLGSLLFNRRTDNIAYVATRSMPIDITSEYGQAVLRAEALRRAFDSSCAEDAADCAARLRQLGMSRLANQRVSKVEMYVVPKLVEEIERWERASVPPYKSMPEGFFLVFKDLAKKCGLSDDEINICARSRNAGVHAMAEANPLVPLGLFLKVLIDGCNRRTDRALKRQPSVFWRVFWGNAPVALCGAVVGLVPVALLAYAVVVIISLFAGRTPIEKLRYDGIDDREVSILLNEVLGQKDVDAVLDLQRKTQWVDSVNAQAAQKVYEGKQ